VSSPLWPEQFVQRPSVAPVLSPCNRPNYGETSGTLCDHADAQCSYEVFSLSFGLVLFPKGSTRPGVREVFRVLFRRVTLDSECARSVLV
jgi:hypothetical protein